MTERIIKVLRVVSSREGFRRAGRVFGKAAQDLPLDTLSDADRAAIESDPTLAATEAGIAVPVQVEGAQQAQGEVETETPPPAVAKPAAAKAAAAGRKRTGK